MSTGVIEQPADVAEQPPRHAVIAEIEGEVAEVCGHLHAASGRLVALTARVLADGLWSQPGVRSPEHWLTWQTGVAPATARRVVAAARRLDELPRTLGAVIAGELSLDQASPIVDRAPSWADATMCDIARCATVTQIRRAVAGYATASPGPDGDGVDHGDAATDGADHGDHDHGDPAPVDPPAEGGDPDLHRGEGVDDPGVDAADPERVSLTQNVDGSWNLHGRLDPDHGALLDAALRSVSDGLREEVGRVPSRAAALVELARRHVDGIDDSARRDRYRVHFLLDERLQLVDPFGHTLPTWLRDVACCDPDISVTWQRNGIPIAHSRSSTTISAATRRHVARRDHGRCRVPGCNSRRADIHHIVHRSAGGSNHPENLAFICPHHHRLHHRGLLGIAGNPELPDTHPDGLRFTDANGRPLTPNRLVRPPTGPPPAPTGTYRHPLGERLNTWWIDYEPPPSARPPQS